MAVETVRVAFLRDELTATLVDGVSVRVFDTLGNLITMARSGVLEAGTAQFDIEGSPEGTTYQLRCFHAGTAIAPKNILVVSPPATSNDFVVMVETFMLEPATDPRMCRCSGQILAPNGKPKRNADLTFWPKYGAFVAHPSAALSGRFMAKTDDQGMVSVDLFRYGMYQVTIGGPEAVTRDIQVPDRSAVLLSHLLFPVVVAVAYLPDPPYAIPVGNTLELVPRVLATDYRDLGPGYEDVRYDTADPSIASVQIMGDRILVRGNSPGTTTLRATRLDNTVVYLPDFGIAGGSLPIVVNGPGP